MKVLLAGASGFLGSALAKRLAEQGDEVRRLVRRAPVGDDEFIWDPTHGEADEHAFSGVDAVVNLCGAGVFDRPWTAARKAELVTSRIEPTSTLAGILARRAAAGSGSPVLVQGAAIGWYGVEPTERPHTEPDPAGSDFLATLCKDWEAATSPATEAGIRVVTARTSTVLDGSGGAFKIMRVPFSIGFGAILGNGEQHMPLISLRDWIAGITWMITNPEAAGPVNLTVPTPVSNAEFSQTLAAKLHRPLRITAPERFFRQILGPMADQLFGDINVVPQVLLDGGFAFTDPTCDAVVDTALR